MKGFIPAFILALLIGVVAYGLSLTDVPNIASTVKVKEVINANNTLIEAAVADPTEMTLAAASVLIGDAGGNAAAQALAGDVTVDTNGTTAIGSAVIVNADVSTTAAIAASKLETMSPGQIVIGNATSNGAVQTVSGDVAIGTNGAVTIQANAIDAGDITAGAITNDDINANATIAGSKLDLTSVTEFRMSGMPIYSPSDINVTNTQVLPATAGVYLLDTSGAATTVTVANASAAGQSLVIINTVATNITITEGGNLNMAGSMTLGEWDSITFYAAAAADWVEVSRSNN